MPESGESIELTAAPPLVANPYEPGPGGGGQSITVTDSAPTLRAKPYDPGPERETIRGHIARVLIWALVLFLGFALVSSWIFMVPDNRKALQDVLQLIIGPLIALVGAVTGFYFGEKSR